jgi:hypothetical protein
MGTATWDKRLLNDVELSYSHVKWDKKRLIFVVHRDFEIPAGDLAGVVAALGNHATFKADMPGLLLKWVAAAPPPNPPAPPPPIPPSPPAPAFPPGTRGVRELAYLIQVDRLDGNFWEWRFGISPIYPKPGANYIFEARLIFDSKKKAFSANIGEDNIGSLSSLPFHTALANLHANHQDIAPFLNSVFPDGVNSH